MAIAEVVGRTSQEFLEVFNACRYESIARTIDASPVASALIEWFDKRGQQTTELPLQVLFAQVETFKPNGSDSWPRSAKGFGDALRSAAPALRQMGIECRSLDVFSNTDFTTSRHAFDSFFVYADNNYKA